jgi:cell division protein FtsW (lipid II flippase)
VNFVFPNGTSPKDQTQSRLFQLAALFLVLYSVVLTLSPAVRLHSWQVNYRWSQWIGVAAWFVGFIAIHRLSMRHLPERDPYLIPIVSVLAGWGLLTIWRLGNDIGLRQTVWLALSTVAFGMMMTRPRVILLLRRYKYLWLTGGLLITGLTFILGTYPGGDGPHLWLGCCGVYLQPSEPLKLLLVIYLAAYLADRSLLRLGLFSLLLPTLILGGAAMVILIGQRDLGTATLFIVVYSVVIYLASGKRRVLVISAILILAAAFIGYQLFSVIQVRLAGWLNPWVDASGKSYQIVQSLLAIASGGTMGNGPGIGNPGIVPVAQSDFIFAAISEETGLTGTIGLMVLLGILAIRGLVIALRASNVYQRFLAAGITVNLMAQSILIIGGNLRLLPLTGVTLPFVSYGGSSLLTSFISIALLALISNHSEDEVAALPNPRPFIFTGGLLLVSLLAAGTVNAYWSVIRNADLQQRTDNPRWAVNDRYVGRGNILDRNNQPIAITTGTPGNYQRTLLQPDLGPIIGYSNPLYGQAGLEASLDGYLRGLQGNLSSTVEFYQLFYAQTPPGLNVRLSIDLKTQKLADTLLAGKAGALVLLNADTGEVLAMSSHPGFDPNTLDENWNVWSKDPRGLFVNRATQGQYPPGTALSPFVLAIVLGQQNLPTQAPPSSIIFNASEWDCAIPVSGNNSWGELISHGCPGAANSMAQLIRPDQLNQLIHQIELDRAPQINLPVATVKPVQAQADSNSLALGEGNLLVSPLQMALAAAALSPQGNIPASRIASAYQSALQGWVVLPGPQAFPMQQLNRRAETTQFLQSQDLPIWEVTATALALKGKIAWYLAGTIDAWHGTPLTLALVLEENDPSSAQKIGENILKTLLLP